MKFNIGDKVKVKKYIRAGETYSGILFNIFMAKERENHPDSGLAVEQCFPSAKGYHMYKLENSSFYWGEKMLKLVN